MMSTSSAARSERRPTVLIVGQDVHKRLELMLELREDFDVSAAGSDGSSREEFERHGLEFHHFPLTRGISPLADLRTVRRLTEIFRESAPDVVHAFQTKPAVWARIAARRAGVPVVIGTIPGIGSLYTTSTWSTWLTRPIYEWLQRWACGVSDVTIFQNQGDLEHFRSRGICAQSDAVVIPSSGVRLNRFSQGNVSRERVRSLRGEIEAGAGTVLVTMIARLIRSKGVLEFARAAGIVRDSDPTVQFLLVGPEDPGSVEALTAEELEEVRRSVRWIGERSDIPEILAASDVFVLPSYREGAPRVLIEASGMRLPLVAASNPGTLEIIQDEENGLLVDAGDADQLAAAVLRLAGNEDLRHRMGERACQIARRRFDITVIARKTGDLYRSCLAEPADARQLQRRSGEATRVV